MTLQHYSVGEIIIIKHTLGGVTWILRCVFSFDFAATYVLVIA